MKPAWETGAGFSALAIAGVLALNYPLLSLFDRDALVFGIPLPYLHVFAVWTLLIVGLAVLAEYRSRRTRSRETASTGGTAGEPGNTGDRDPVNDAAAPVFNRQHDKGD